MSAEVFCGGQFTISLSRYPAVLGTLREASGQAGSQRASSRTSRPKLFDSVSDR